MSEKKIKIKRRKPRFGTVAGEVIYQLQITNCSFITSLVIHKKKETRRVDEHSILRQLKLLSNAFNYHSFYFESKLLNYSERARFFFLNIILHLLHILFVFV